MYKHYRHLCFLFALLMILMSICGFLVIGMAHAENVTPASYGNSVHSGKSPNVSTIPRMYRSLSTQTMFSSSGKGVSRR